MEKEKRRRLTEEEKSARMQEMLRLVVEERLTFSQVGTRFGMSRQRVKQIVDPTGSILSKIKEKEKEERSELLKKQKEEAAERRAAKEKAVYAKKVELARMWNDDIHTSVIAEIFDYKNASVVCSKVKQLRDMGFKLKERYIRRSGGMIEH